MTVYLHKGKPVSRTYYKNLKTRRSRALRAAEIVKRYSKEGKTIKEAAIAANMTLCGVKTLLWRLYGTTAWPITND